jgi:predicted GIY-YIG superfamily endonuclease
MEYIIYWLISENYKNTYVGFSNDISARIAQHRAKQVRTTRNFGKFRCFKIEKTDNPQKARQLEKYWKSSHGRKRLKQYYEKIINNLPPSSSG